MWEVLSVGQVDGRWKDADEEKVVPTIILELIVKN